MVKAIMPFPVIPAEAGIQSSANAGKAHAGMNSHLDPGLRRGDN